LLVIEDSGETPARSLLSKYPELVIVNGRPVLASAGFAAKYYPPAPANGFFALQVEGRGHYWVAVDVPALVRQTRKVLHQDLHLAGKAIAA
jgi:hypothetical protein